MISNTERVSRAQPLIDQLYGNFDVDPRTTVDDPFHKLSANPDERFPSYILIYLDERNPCEYPSCDDKTFGHNINANYLQ